MAAPRLYEEVLRDWQREAVAAWELGDGEAPYRGTLEVFTGGGKTLMALAAYQKLLRGKPDPRLAVVVPTAALQGQWVASVHRWLGVDQADIGRLGDDGDDDLTAHRVLICVINSAADRLPELAREHDVMLVVDECHRAGAPKFRRVLDTPASYRLGLSATPERIETDEHGLPIPFDDQPVARKLGRVVHRYSLKDARASGWLPTYRLVHHGVALTDEERSEYERLSRRISDLQDQLSDLGVAGAALTRVGKPGGGTDELLNALRGLTGRRKHLLYRASERRRIAERLVGEARERDEHARILLFHERVDEAEAIHAALRNQSVTPDEVELEHSRLPGGQRRQALERFRAGRAPVLVSVKSLVEGLDVPEASVGISVAASTSVRQRIQTLGRVLRRDFGDNPRDVVVRMHLLYVADTVDEVIYEGEDWEDLTGADANEYLSWPLGAGDPTVEPAPPRTPRLTEDQAQESFGAAPRFPQPWPGTLPALEFSVSTTGAVTTEDGTVVANPQGVGDLVASVRGSPGGRFRVTDLHRYVIVGHRGDTRLVAGVYAAGQLAEHFRAPVGRDKDAGEVDASSFAPGDKLPTQPDKLGGTFKIRSTRGGVIERRRGRTAEFAVDEGEDASTRQAIDVLDRWRGLGLSGMTFFASSDGIAWYAGPEGPAFLAPWHADLRFPSDEDETTEREATGGPSNGRR